MTTNAHLPPVKITDSPVPLPAGVVLPPLVANGGRAFREVRVPLWCDADFKKLWATGKLKFRQRGFTVRLHNSSWWLQQWLQGAPGAWTLTPIGAEALARLTAPARPTAPPDEIPVELICPPLPQWIEEKLLEYVSPENPGHQALAARQLLRALTCGKDEWGYSGAWDCSDLGTGKTYQSLAAAIAFGKRIGVICPKSVIGSTKAGSGWLGAFRHWGQQPEFILNYESLRTGNKGFLRKTGHKGRPFEWAVDPQEVLLIFDEAHNCKNVSLNRSMAMAATRQDFSLLYVSGTMAAKPTNLGATGIAVGLHAGTAESYEHFLLTHGCYKVGDAFEFDRYRGTAHLARIHRTVFPRRGARVRISDLGDKFPETQILCEAIETDDTKAIVAAYAQVEAMLETMQEQGKKDHEIKAAQRIAYMAVRKKSEIAKIPSIIGRAKEELAEGRSVAIFLNFTEAREKIMKLLGTNCGIFGGQDARARDEAIRKFQSDESRVIVVMSQAGGTGVSLHDINGEFPRTALICPDDNAVTLGQVLGRVHRAGGKSRSRQIILFAADTVEEGICNNVRGKLANIKSVNDGDLNPEHAF